MEKLTQQEFLVHNRSYCIHNFLWVLLSPIGFLIIFIMYEFDVNFLRVFPSADIIISACMDILISTLCLSLIFWLFVKCFVNQPEAPSSILLFTLFCFISYTVCSFFQMR